MTAKTMGLPPTMLVRLEARADLWNKKRGERPPNMGYGDATWADVVRTAVDAYLGKPVRAQGRPPLKKARKR